MKPAETEFQGMRLRQARLAADMTGAQLAELIGVSRQALSAYEAGKAPGADTLGNLAAALGVEPAYFFMPVPAPVLRPSSAIYFRALQRSPEFQKSRAICALSWTAEMILRLTGWLELPAARMPDGVDCDPETLSEEDIDRLARETRRFFGLGHGPIDRLILLLENHGVLVGHAAMGEDMDGVSAWFGERPIMLIRAGTTWARARFDAAHELAHLVLHRGLLQEDADDPVRHRLMENQANRFAGAFLLPEEGYAAEVFRVDLDALLELKRRWGVSVQGQIVRLKQLGMLSSHQYTRLWQNVSRRGWRKSEPMDRDQPAEQPVLLRRAADFVAKHQLAPFHEVFTGTRFPRSFLRSLANLSDQDLVPNTLDTANVIAFRRREAV